MCTGSTILYSTYTHGNELGVFQPSFPSYPKSHTPVLIGVGYTNTLGPSERRSACSVKCEIKKFIVSQNKHSLESEVFTGVTTIFFFSLRRVNGPY